MKKEIAISALLMGLTVLSSAALAGPTGSFTAVGAKTAPKIDGSIADWDLAAYSQPTFILDPSVSFVRSGEFSNPKCHNAKVWVSYDAKNVYIGADVVDDNIQGTASGNGIWGNTNIEVWLNGGDITNPTAVAGAEPYEDEDFQIDLSVMTEGEKTPSQWVYSHGLDDSTGVKVAVQYTKVGYTLEASLPKADFAGLDAFKANGKYAMAISTVYFLDGAWSGLFSPGPKWEYATLTIK